MKFPLLLSILSLSFLVFATEENKANPNSLDSELSFHIQTTMVTQGHSSFPSPYQGQNSLVPSEDAQTSFSGTVFTGFNLHRFGEVYFDPELSGGGGLSKTLGVAGFPNAEIYRVDSPLPTWDIARFYLKEVFGLGGAQEKFEEDKNQVATTYDTRRFTVILGKFSLNDFIDNNSYSHDPRTQFLNWTLMDYGAWDYAADTRGYSWGVFLELNQDTWALRFASVLEPVGANQLNLDMNVAHAHGDNLEFEYRYHYLEQPGILHLLAFENHADMGNYQQALGGSSPPVITSTRQYSQKYGFGLGIEQKFSERFGAFSRLSWNDGSTESWTFTEVDQSVTAGLSWTPQFFKEHADTLGVAAIVNDISLPHRNYLAAGGYGFLLGDGRLNYVSEKILETFYLIHVTKEWSVTFDYQFISDPAYNADRGPVSVFAGRLHYEI